ncbi:MAG: phosphatidylserine decarboxylase [Oscillospiraceae bacterium]
MGVADYTLSDRWAEAMPGERGGGLCLIFRLCVGDYHRYCYMDWGAKGENHFLPGVLHTVRPIALAGRVFTQPAESAAILNTEHFMPRHPDK